MFQPVHGLAIELFLDSDVRHGGGGRRSIPVLLAWRKPHDVSGPDLLDRPGPPGIYRPDVNVSLSAFGTACMTATARTLCPDAMYNQVNGNAVSTTEVTNTGDDDRHAAHA
jgi:hypothetical protein